MSAAPEPPKETPVSRLLLVSLGLLLAACARSTHGDSGATPANLQPIDGSPTSAHIEPTSTALQLPRATLSGVVIAHDGKPARGATVRLHYEDHVVSLPGPSTTTDADGRFAFPAVQSDHAIALYTSHPDHAWHEESMGLLRPGCGYSVELKLDRGVPLRFRLVDQRGEPIPTAWVGDDQRRFIRPDADAWFDYRARSIEPWSIRTGNAGHAVTVIEARELAKPEYQDDVDPDDPSLVVDPDTGAIGPMGHPTWPRVDVSEARWRSARELQLDVATHSTVRLVHPDGTPAASAKVTRGNEEQCTDEGVVTLTGKLESETPLEVATYGSRQDFVVGPPGSERRIVVPRGGDVEFRVDPPSESWRIVFASVRFELDGELQPPEGTYGVGVARFDNLPAGRIEWESHARGHAEQRGTLVIRPGELIRVDVTVPLRSTIQRTVRIHDPEGAPIEGACVVTDWGPATTDSAGAAVLTLPPHIDETIRLAEESLEERARSDDRLATLACFDATFFVEADGYGRQYFLYPKGQLEDFHLVPLAKLIVSATRQGAPVTRADEFMHQEIYESVEDTSDLIYFQDEEPTWTYETNVELPLELTVDAGVHVIMIDGHRVRVSAPPGETTHVHVDLDRK